MNDKLNEMLDEVDEIEVSDKEKQRLEYLIMAAYNLGASECEN